MLAELYIQNIAVIQKAAIRFSDGLNVFTGETGAGKTVLISAIDMVLGERTSRDIIRTGEEKAVTSALFENISPAARKKLRELGYEDDDGTVLITREMNQSGKNTCKIGGMPATVSILKQISSLLLHVHGQRDSAQLLLREHHLELVDSFGELEAELAVYRQVYRQLREKQEECRGLAIGEAEKAQRMDMLRYQIAEIEGACLEDPQEEEALDAQRRLIRNSAKIVEGLSQGYQALEGSGEAEGINNLLDLLLGGIGTAAEYMGELAPMAARLEEISYELAEYAGDIRTSLDELEFDPRELDNIEQRLDAIYKLKRKYGPDIGEILGFCEGAREELEGITTAEQRLEALENEIAVLEKRALKLAACLSKKRRQAAERFCGAVEAELAFLDMPSVKLSVQVKGKELSGNGTDELELFIVTNVGEEPKQLSKIASGGEIARIMLAVKNVLADRDGVDTLIFDEVDTGVSGRAAGKIGRKLGEVARNRQVICVTHLAQVAAFAQNHLLIEKQVEDNRTFTHVLALDHLQRIRELARITSGDLLTDTALQSAGELWEHSQKLLDK